MRCEVIRDGKQVEIRAIDVVVGDLLMFKVGQQIPVDTRVVQIKTNSKLKENVLRSDWGLV